MPRKRRFFSARPRLVLQGISLAALLVFAPAAAAESYAASTGPCAARTSWGSGGLDSAGTLYVACGTSIQRIAKDGTRLADVCFWHLADIDADAEHVRS